MDLHGEKQKPGLGSMSKDQDKPGIGDKPEQTGDIQGGHPQYGQLRLINNADQFYGSREGGLSNHEAEKPSQGALSHFPVPRELRDRIYHLVFKLPNSLISEEAAVAGFITHKKSHPSRQSHAYPLERNAGSPFDLALLLVSKTIYLEAYQVFYRINTLYFKDTDILHDFLSNIGPARRHALAHIGFNWTGADPKAAFRLLKSCGNLKTLRFTLPISFPPGYAALREVRGLENVIRLTRFMFNENYGRTVKQWCTEKDEDITQEEMENEDEIEMASERRVPSFLALREGMMRERTPTQEKRLAEKMEKVVALGGGKK